ncbi:PIN domain-containing protein [bacterium]|nr:PIN domain-containing protein [bacterium]
MASRQSQDVKHRSHFTALLDACVLFPAGLRDTLIRLAATGLYRARWAEQIHDEWTRAVLRRRSDLTADSLQRTCHLMNQAVPDCLVEGYEPLIDSLTLPDADDRHVLAAAIAGKADVIVTLNLKHFPQTALAPFGIEAQHPDDFICHLLDLAPETVCESIRQQRAALKNPPKTVAELLDTLRNEGLPKTAAALNHFADDL